MICETMSGGVMIAASTKMSTIVTRRPFASHSAFNTPRLVSSTETTGSSNTTPKITNTVSKKLTYCWMLMEALTSTSCEKPIRKRSMKGMLMKRAKATPAAKNSVPASSASAMPVRSLLVRPGPAKA